MGMLTGLWRLSYTVILTLDVKYRPFQNGAKSVNLNVFKYVSVNSQQGLRSALKPLPRGDGAGFLHIVGGVVSVAQLVASGRVFGMLVIRVC